MKRIIKINERVWWEDDHMNGWGTIALVAGEDSKPEYIEGDDTIITIKKDTGGEIETTVDHIYQLAPYTFQGAQCCWEFNETQDDYPLFCPERYENCFFFECERDDFYLTENKTPEQIRAFFHDTFQPVESAMREMCRKYVSRKLMDTSEDEPLECGITVEPDGAFGLSSLEMPNITQAWQDPSSGEIYFNEEYNATCDFDNYPIHELIQIVEQI